MCPICTHFMQTGVVIHESDVIHPISHFRARSPNFLIVEFLVGNVYRALTLILARYQNAGK